MTKVIIVPSNTDLNRGDQALVWESLRLVQDVFGKENVDCLLMADLDSTDSYIQNNQTSRLGYKFIDTILKHPGRKFSHKESDSKSYTKLTLIQWGGQAIIDYIRIRPLMSTFPFIRKIGELLLSAKEKSTIEEFKQADAIFVKGGGFIHSYGSITDPYFIFYLTNTLRIAQAYGKKVIMLPNSIGPLKNSIARSIAVNTLNRCTLVTVRENISKEYLDKLGVKALLYPDLGFFLKPSERDMRAYLADKGIPLDRQKVVITLRPYRFLGFINPNELFDNYIVEISNLVNHLYSKGYHVTFLAHTLGPSSHEDDRIAIKEVIHNLPKKLRDKVTYIEDFNLNCKEVESIYSCFDYMIGTRFHSVIFSINVNVPSIAIAYGGNKGKGIMDYLGNSAYSIDMDKIYENSLVQLFDMLEKNTIDFREKLEKSREMINQKRDELIMSIRKELVLDN